MRTLKLDVLTGDIAIENNKFILINGADRIRQNLLTRLRTYLGEWFLNINIGIPYYQDVFVKGLPIGQVTGVFKDEITSTPGVDELTKFDAEYVNSNRNLSINFEVKYGEETIPIQETI
jgi:hypothetical protein